MLIKKPWKNKSFLLSFCLTLLFLSVCFACLHYGLVSYGWFVFAVAPVVLGWSIGALPRKGYVIFGMFLALALFLTGLVALGLEGVICVFSALGIYMPLIFLGAIINRIFNPRDDEDNNAAPLKVLAAPFMLFLLLAPFEEKTTFLNKASTLIILPYTPEQVFDEIKSVDTLDVHKSSLMHIGLPVPYKCVLDKEEPGATRTCYFGGGKIVEKITEIERGKNLNMVVTSYQLTGRKWLGFRDALYEFEKLGPQQTKLTRITTYTSELKPRIYWQPLEEWAIQQEHDFVFRNLEKHLQVKYGK